MNGFYTALVTILTAIIGVAIVAVLVSPNAKTSNVIGTFFSGFGGALGTAISPVTSGAGSGYGALYSGNLGGLGSANL